MKRRMSLLVASTAFFVAFATGCAGLSTVREELALRELAKRSYAKCHHNCPSGLYSRDFERGWRQAYYNVSRGFDACPPSVPPEVYWSTKYQNPQGCKSIAAWYQGYSAGASTAVSECRSGFSKVPLIANCVREEEMQCTPVQPLRHPAVEGFVFNEALSGEVMETASVDSFEDISGDLPLTPSRVGDEVLAQDPERVESSSPRGVEINGDTEPQVIRTSFPGPVRLPEVE